MAKYFHVSHGLRGCYMPDNSEVIKVETRRELKTHVSNEAKDMREAYGFGGSKKEIATFVVDCWNEAKKPNPGYLPYCLPFGRKPGDYPFGIFISVATRREYLDYVKETELT
jgi:hypothetical protein